MLRMVYEKVAFCFAFIMTSPNNCFLSPVTYFPAPGGSSVQEESFVLVRDTLLIRPCGDVDSYLWTFPVYIFWDASAWSFEVCFTQRCD